mmetsp:Transcript_72178/g.116406  ORF Transcript_72178/g.116406 Transcript_72178/m.116406 type:complete len:379 (+) Transcript_72178:758-1894(+)
MGSANLEMRDRTAALFDVAVAVAYHLSLPSNAGDTEPWDEDALQSPLQGSIRLRDPLDGLLPVVPLGTQPKLLAKCSFAWVLKHISQELPVIFQKLILQLSQGGDIHPSCRQHSVNGSVGAGRVGQEAPVHSQTAEAQRLLVLLALGPADGRPALRATDVDVRVALEQPTDHPRGATACSIEHRGLALVVLVVDIATFPDVKVQTGNVVCLGQVVGCCLPIDILLVDLHTVGVHEESHHLCRQAGVLHGVENERLAKLIHLQRVVVPFFDQPLDFLHVHLPHDSALPLRPSHHGHLHVLAAVQRLSLAELTGPDQQVLLNRRNAGLFAHRLLQIFRAPVSTACNSTDLAAEVVHMERHLDDSGPSPRGQASGSLVELH